MATDPKIVSLGNIVGHDDPRPLANARKDCQQNSSFKRLGLIHDDVGVMEGSPANMCQRQNFNQAAVENFIDDWLTHQSAQGVKNCLRPWRHFFVFTAWQISELLSADGIERTEDDDLLMLAPLHHCFEPGT